VDVYRSVIITGGKGMLGHELRAALAARGVAPVITDRAECDITDPAQLTRLFQLHRPTLLLNCAAHTGVDQCEHEPELANLINGKAVGDLARLSHEFHTKLVHFSTDFVFDGHIDRPYRPDDTPNPLSAYGRSKLFGEEYVKQLSPPHWLTVRTSWLFGRHGHCFPKAIIDRARSGHPLKVVNDQTGCPTYAVDLAAAVLEMIDRNATGIWHVTNSTPTTWYKFARAILKQFEIAAEVTPISTAQWMEIKPKQAIRPSYSVLETGAYSALTGKQMRPWLDALRDYRNEVIGPAAKRS
jgi:dTDP-4-dehydrorhamnose reductase